MIKKMCFELGLHEGATKEGSKKDPYSFKGFLSIGM